MIGIPEGFEPIVEDELPAGFEPIAIDHKQDLIDTVSNVYPDVKEDKETVEKLKTVQYLAKKGYSVTPDNADDFRSKLFPDDSSYESINKKLATQLSVEPLGEVKKSAKMKPSYGFKAALSKMAQLPIRARQGIQAYGLWTEHLAEKVMSGRPEGRRGSYDPKKIEDQKEFFREELKTGREVIDALDQYYTSDIPDEVKQTIPYMMAGALGELPKMALYLTPVTAPFAAASDYGQMIDEGYEEARAAVDEDGNRKHTEGESLNIAMGYGVLAGTAEVVIDKFTAGIGGDLVKAGKPLRKQIGNMLKKSQIAGGIEFFVEGGSSAGLQKATKGEVDWRQATLEGFLGYFVASVGGNFYGAVNATQTAKTRKFLAEQGFSESEVEVITNDLADAKTKKEADVVLNSAFDSMAERVGAFVNNMNGDTQQKDVTGIEGTPLDSSDLEWMRNNKDFMDGLDDSPEADLLRRAVNENDLAALAEYNQGLAGVEPDADQETTNGKPVPRIVGDTGPQEMDFEPMDMDERYDATEEQLDAEDAPQSTNIDPEADIPMVIGGSRRSSSRLNKALGLDVDLSPDERRSNVNLIEGAMKLPSSFVRKVVKDVNDGIQKGVSDQELAAMTIMEADILNEIEDTEIELLKAYDINDNETYDEMYAELARLEVDLIDTQKAMKTGLTAAARTLQAASVNMNRKTFTIANILAQAHKVAGDSLTPELRQELRDMGVEMKGLQLRIQELEAEQARIDEIKAKAVAEGVLEGSLSETRAGIKKEQTASKRDKAKKNILGLGYRVNDVVGLPFAVSKELASIAMSHIEDGATTIEEVVTRTIQDVPDMTPKNIYDALGSRVKKGAKRVETELEQTIKELKKQAKLLGEIEDSINKISLPYNEIKREPSEQVDDLKEETAKIQTKLKLYSSSVIQTERDPIRVRDILEKVNHIELLVESKSRDIKVKRVKTKELKTAEKKLATANATLSAQDRLFILKEVAEYGRQTLPESDNKIETSEGLLALRKEITAFEALIKKQDKKTKAMDADQKRLDKQKGEFLTILDEVENLHRKIQTKQSKGEDVNADMKLERKRQDKVFRLVDEINNGKPESEKIDKVEAEDSKGYLGMIELLQTELKSKKTKESKERADQQRVDDQNSRIDIMFDQLENIYRNLPENKKVDKSPLDATEAQARQNLADQSRVYELIEVLKNKQLPDKKTTSDKADPFGYRAVSELLKTSIKNSEWNQAMRQAGRDVLSLERSRANIKQMTEDLKANNLDPYTTLDQKSAVKSDELVEAKLEEQRLKKEIQRRLWDLKPRTKSEMLKELISDIKSMKLTADLGHIFRQGGFVMGNPLDIVKFGTVSWGAMFSGDYANRVDLSVLENKHYANAINSNLHIIEEGQKLGEREMIVSSKILKKVPAYGKLVEASERTQITSLNFLRMDLFSKMMESSPDATKQDMEDYATYINIVTGYGVDGLLSRDGDKWVGQTATVLDNVLISTRFKLSRIQTPLIFLSPRLMKNKVVRNRYLRDLSSYWLLRAAMVSLIDLVDNEFFGDKITIGRNPSHSGTFGKIIVKVGGGKVRVYDPLSGLKNTYQTIYSVASGAEEPVDAIVKDLMKSKNPFWQLLGGMITGEKYGGEEASRWELLARSALPISAETPLDATLEQTGLVDALVGTFLDIHGIGSYTTDKEDIFGKPDLKALQRGKPKKKKTVYKFSDRDSVKRKERERAEQLRKLKSMKP